MYVGAEIREGLISQFSDVFITINRHKLKWKSRGLTREIHENNTTAKITTYVYSIFMLVFSGQVFNGLISFLFSTYLTIWLELKMKLKLFTQQVDHIFMKAGISPD